MLDKKIFEQFLKNSSSKWALKQERQRTISTMPLAGELLTNMQCSSEPKSFASEMRALKLKCSRQPLAVDKDQLKGSSKMILLQLHEKLHSTQCQSFYGHSALEANWKVKKLHKWVNLVSWPKIKNTVVLKCYLFILCNNNEPFLDQIVTCNEKCTLYN